MARPQKQTVDYFPHDAHTQQNDTLTVLQNRFGNNGYAAWFKLLEKLASTDGHFIDCRTPAKWQVLIARLGIDEITTIEIMEILVEMQAIDFDLWQSRVIWCQHFVDNIAGVYKNRRQKIPLKPVITGNNPVFTPDNPIIACSLPVETPQSKVKYSKVKYSKVNKDKDIALPDWIDKKTWDAFLEMRKTKKAPATSMAQELIIKTLADFKERRGQDVNKVLEQSIVNSWKDVYEIKNNGGQNGQQNGATRAYRGNPSQKPAGAFVGLDQD